MSAPVPLGYAESGDCTERKEDKTQNKITGDPSDDCAGARQDAEQNKVARLGVHARLRLERGSDQAAPLARVDSLEPLMRSPRADGRPSFWERPGHALPDLEAPSRGATLVGQGRLAMSMNW